ncbi:MAG: alpha/beta hydrolase [Moorea sp. SIO4A3]|nr:alpha/beta hydrolase [Moorena sp. SIO4A3]
MALNSSASSSPNTDNWQKSLHKEEFYTWHNYRCAYEVYTPTDESAKTKNPLLLVHPIGVGLSRFFWHRFCQQWLNTGNGHLIYNPDLLGCGESEMPPVAYYPIDWADQLQYFLTNVVKKPVILLVQGALLPVALTLIQKQTEPNYIQGLVLSGPPSWSLMTAETQYWQQRVAWNLLESPLGSAFFRYARRRQFLQKFSENKLFAESSTVDKEWLDNLQKGAINPASRYAVFSFLAGFWRQNYQQAIANTSQPTLVVVGEQASSISKLGKSETPEDRLAQYIKHLPQGEGRKIPGRNVLPYESTYEFVKVVGDAISSFE